MILCQLVSNPCRDIVEGVTHLRTVRTVDVVPFVVAPKEREEGAGRWAVGAGAKKRRKQSVAEFFAAFRASKPGEFTAKTFYSFAAALGYDGGLTDATSFISRARVQGAVKNLRRCGNGFVMKFGKETMTAGNFAGKI